MKAVVRRLSLRRYVLLITFDAAAWAIGLAVAALARMDFDSQLVPWDHLAVAWMLVVVT